MGGTRFYKEGKYTAEKAETSLLEGWDVGSTGNIKPDIEGIKKVPFEIYPVYNSPSEGGKLIGYNICRIWCTCIGYDKYLESRLERRPEIEIYNMELPCSYHKKDDT